MLLLSMGLLIKAFIRQSLALWNYILLQGVNSFLKWSQSGKYKLNRALLKSTVIQRNKLSFRYSIWDFTDIFSFSGHSMPTKPVLPAQANDKESWKAIEDLKRSLRFQPPTLPVQQASHSNAAAISEIAPICADKYNLNCGESITMLALIQNHVTIPRIKHTQQLLRTRRSS